MDKSRVVFMGTPDFAVPILEMLIASTNVVMVVTQPDKEVGRQKIKQKSPVKLLAEQKHIPIFQPSRIKKDYEAIKEVKPDLIVTCAYGQIIPASLLEVPSKGCVNVHASLLPKYRGSAPIQWALINGEKETGITLMYMDEFMDTGDIIAYQKIPILASDDVGTLHNKLAILGKDLLKENLEAILNNKAKRIKQDDSKATLAPMIKREDEYLNFQDNGQNILNKIRALSPWPLAYFILNDQEIKIIKASFHQETVLEPKLLRLKKDSLEISCLDGYISLEIIKPFGKKEMAIKNYLNGLNKQKEMVVK